MSKIWVRLKDKPSKQIYIEESEYDESKHIKPTKEEAEKEKILKQISFKEILKSGKAPGMFMRVQNRSLSPTYKGKLDSGAAEELLDVGLEGAKTRAKERQNKYGSSFKKVKQKRLKSNNKMLRRRKS